MIYTKTGDKGTTSLVGGTRVKKCDDRVDAYGTVDELNAQIGLLAEWVKSIDDEAYKQLKTIQNRLFEVQTLLATEEESLYAKMPQLPADAVSSLEQSIDFMDGKLPRHNRFVIPGGSIASAQGHVARTVCRRAERAIARLSENASVAEDILKYINRLSDYLFVMSRWLLLVEKKEENFWSNE